MTKRGTQKSKIMNHIEKISKIIEKYFGLDDKTKYIHLSDKHNIEEPNFYLQYYWKAGYLELFAGSDNSYTMLFVTDHNYEKLEQLLSVYLQPIKSI